MRRGEIWWANLREPIASEPGHRRPVLIFPRIHLMKAGYKRSLWFACRPT
jgi:hypothetical protein